MSKKKAKQANILIIDDEQSLRDSMQLLLQKQYNLFLAKTGQEGLDAAKNYPIDLVLLDIRLPEINGIEILKQIKNMDESIEVIMLTAVITVGKAVEAMRIGAYDYITKPFDINSLQVQIEKALEKRNLFKENLFLRTALEKDNQFERIVGKSRAIKEIFKTIDTVAKSKASILITGESGTGKELVAKAIHNRSQRKDKLFVALNCAAIPENLLESELFGHEKGSFTGAIDRQIGKFEVANGGTLFLDEIGSMPMPMQSKLLRAIQEKEIQRIGASYPTPVDVRIISATNSDLKAEIKNYKFREDLYYRINVIPIHIPALRDRKEDIELLAYYFLSKECKEFGKNITEIKPSALHQLTHYAWPGNVRELENLMERLVVLTQTNIIGEELLPQEIRNDKIKNLAPNKVRFFDAVKQFELDFIKKALAQTNGRKSKTSKLLGVHRNTLINMERKLGLQKLKWRQ